MDCSTINLKDYQIIEKIGEGGFGEVFKVKEIQSGIIYAAKSSLKSIDDNNILEISREINILSRIKHPYIIRFIGFSSSNFYDQPKPVILTEYLPNGSLEDIISLERRGLAKDNWSNERKLINIYGIASSMSFLHERKIIHRDLKPGNILMDEFLCPKIGDFGLSKTQHSASSISFDSAKSTKGTPQYISPEIWANQKYSKASDVYAFGVIVFEIITLEEPFKNLEPINIGLKEVEGKRPHIDSAYPSHYRDLIERCWAQNSYDRPSFNEIVEQLRTDDSFTNDLIDKEDFYDFVEYLDQIKPSFYSRKQVMPIDQFIKRKSKTFVKISIKENLPSNKKNFQSIKENLPSNKKRRSIFPFKEYIKLSKECKQLVDNAEDDADMQFEIGFCLVEGEQNFPVKTQIGIRYLEKSIRNGCVDAMVYYSRMLIEAEIVPQDLNKAEEILNNCSIYENPDIPLLLGLIKKKQGEYNKAIEFFRIASGSGNEEGQYYLGKMLYKGLGCKRNQPEAMKLFRMSKKNGFEKVEQFLSKHETPKLTKLEKTIKLGDGKNKEITKQRIDDEDGNFFYMQGLKYFDGEGVLTNKTEAVRYFKMAIDKGHSDAMYKYANMLRDGEGIPMNKTEAVRYYKMAIDKGNSDAMYNYANMLDKGEGIPMNKTEAVRYYKMAIDKGNSNAMNVSLRVNLRSRFAPNASSVPKNRQNRQLDYKRI